MAFKFPEQTPEEKERFENRAITSHLKNMGYDIERKENQTSDLAERIFFDWMEGEMCLNEVEIGRRAEKAFIAAESFINIKYQRKANLGLLKEE